MKTILKSLATKIFVRGAGGPQRAFCRLLDRFPLTPEDLLLNYAQGRFPMGNPDGTVHWKCPEVRGVVEPGKVHISKRLKKYLRDDKLHVTFDRCFDEVVQQCATRDETWINSNLKDVYAELAAWKVAHSVEAWYEDEVVGGGFGIRVGKVFFLESMFYKRDHSSKVAFVKLASKLEQDGFALIDCQYVSEHWKRFGFQAVSRQELVRQISQSLSAPVEFRSDRPRPGNHEEAIGVELRDRKAVVPPIALAESASASVPSST